MFDGTEDEEFGKFVLTECQICIGWNKWIAHLTKLLAHV